MRTLIQKKENTITVSFDGKLDFETTGPLKEELFQLRQTSRKLSDSVQFIFDLKNLEFVGSSGISPFIQALREFNASLPTKPRYCHVRSEFKKMIQALDKDELFDFYDDNDRSRRKLNQ